MFEYQEILNEIEQLVEKLPYRTTRIEVELPNQTLVLTKDKQPVVGFCADGN